MLYIDQTPDSQSYRQLVGLSPKGPERAEAFSHECLGPGERYIDAYLQRRGRTTLEPMWWGYVPAWADGHELPRGAPWRVIPIEKAPGSRVFRHAWRNQRCLIPVDAFYVDDPNRLRYRVTQGSGTPMFLAALWDFSRRGNTTTDEHRAFCILSCPAPTELQAICTRMPLIIRAPAYANWLSVAVTEPADIARLAVPDTSAFAVTPYVWNDSHSRLSRPIRVAPRQPKSERTEKKKKEAQSSPTGETG